MLDDMLEEIGGENVVKMVTDNASNYVKAGRYTEQLTYAYIVTCFESSCFPL